MTHKMFIKIKTLPRNKRNKCVLASSGPLDLRHHFEHLSLRPSCNGVPSAKYD